MLLDYWGQFFIDEKQLFIGYFDLKYLSFNFETDEISVCLLWVNSYIPL